MMIKEENQIRLFAAVKFSPEKGNQIKSLKIKPLKMTVETFLLLHSHMENGRFIYTEIGNIKSK